MKSPIIENKGNLVEVSYDDVIRLSKTPEKDNVNIATDGQSNVLGTTSLEGVTSKQDGIKETAMPFVSPVTMQFIHSGQKTSKNGSPIELTPERRLFLSRAILAGLTVDMPIENMNEVQYIAKQDAPYDEKLRMIYSLLPASV